MCLVMWEMAENQIDKFPYNRFLLREYKLVNMTFWLMINTIQK